jgi:predicted tellurium resistance membrane protein TerC
MMQWFTPDAVAALFQVVVIDLSLAGDNAIVVGMAAAGLPQEQRTRAILFGMTGATCSSCSRESPRSFSGWWD